MNIGKTEINQILLGASLLGTGGGGRYDLARKILREFSNSVALQSIDTIGGNDLMVTAFMLGGLRKKGDLGEGVTKAITILKRLLNKEIQFLIPVEIGPTAVMNIFAISEKLQLPVIDGDLVGFRSAPEVYVEAITLNNVNRLPMVAVNLEGDTLILEETSTIAKIETILRSFSAQSKTEVYVAGYPLYKAQIANFFGKGSLLESLAIGRVLAQNNTEEVMLSDLFKRGISLIAYGLIIEQNDTDENGFTKGKILIQTKNDVYEVLYKNEYLVLLKNKRVVLTSPDSILLLDAKRRRGINNAENNLNKFVFLLNIRAIDAWRTPGGRKLFSPKNMGYQYRQKLLK